jgi:putative ABC transport system permease protein
MLSHLDRKLIRDLSRMKGQAIAVSLVMACGLAMLIMARSLILSLEGTRQEYYEAHRFADVFVALKRAPNSLVSRIAETPGVATVQTGISVQATLDVTGLDEPASGDVRSLPDFGEPQLNGLYLRTGSWLAPGSRGQVLVSEAFAEANSLHTGDSVSMLLHGRRQNFRIAGLVLSPEIIFEARPGASLPDNRTFGTFWMPYKEIATAYNLYGAFNYLALTLAPGAQPRAVIAAVDRLLQPYGGRGAYSRADHPSHIRVSDEIKVLQTLSIGFPLVFLSVAAFMVNAVLTRLLALQREQIAILKAFGFSNRHVVLHYLKFAFVMVVAAAILGTGGGIALGNRLVQMYHMFFRFPDLHFRFNRAAALIALAVGAGAATLGVLSAVRRAAKLPPADAMRPEPPADFRLSFLERTGMARLFSHSFRIAARNLERRPAQAFFTVAGLALATGILIVPNCFRDSVNQLLGFQWDVVQRQDMNIGLVEPVSARAQHLMAQLPGVVAAEPFRGAAARIRHGNRSRQLGISGTPADTQHSRVVDAKYREIILPPEGLVVSTKLAEVLDAKVGEDLIIEFLEGQRLVRPVPLVGVSEDLTGIAAHMDLHALNRLLGEGNVINGATFTLDMARRAEFLHALKEIPSVSWVGIKSSLRENFQKTTAASIKLIQSIYMVFAIVVAFGVVYNNARISLAERARELATLRVIGFSEREVGAVLITELVILALVALPMGLLLGTGFAKAIVTSVNTETVRLPVVFTPANYAFATVVVTVASVVSALVVLRRLKNLNLISALKAPE